MWQLDGDNAIDAALDLEFDQALERGFIDRAVAERRDNGGISPRKHGRTASENRRLLARKDLRRRDTP